MERFYTQEGHQIDVTKLELISDRGSEVLVYKYYNTAIKLFRKGYKLSNLTLEEIKTLSEITPQRILLPTGAIWNDNHELVGYQMDLILGEKSIDEANTNAFFAELELLRKDLDLLSSRLVILRDINLSNTIYNGHIFLTDPGNYLIDGLEKIIMQANVDDPAILEEIIRIVRSREYDRLKDLTDQLTDEEKIKYIRRWNYGKINSLIDMLLFINGEHFDSFTLRLIIQFIMQEREKLGLTYNLDVLKHFFDTDLPVGKAVDTFVKEHIKDDPEGRKLYLSL